MRRNLLAISVLAFLLFLGGASNPNKKCQISDSSIIGKWKLAEECACYGLGGDYIWKKVTKNLAFTFNIHGYINAEGDVGTDCNRGTYSITQGEIVVVWMCADGGKVKNVYGYSLNAQSDTLVLKGFVEEGFFGSKFFRQ